MTPTSSPDDLVEAIAARTAELLADSRPAGLIDAKAAAALLGVPRTWVLTEARAGRVPHVRLGRYVRFEAAALTDWWAARRQGAASRKAA